MLFHTFCYHNQPASLSHKVDNDSLTVTLTGMKTTQWLFMSATGAKRSPHHMYSTFIGDSPERRFLKPKETAMNTLRLLMIFTFLAFAMSSTQAMAADPESTAGGAVAGGAAGAVVGVGAGAGALLGGAAGAAAGDELEDRDADRFDADRDLSSPDFDRDRSDSDVAQGFGSGPNISSEITPYDRSIDLDD